MNKELELIKTLGASAYTMYKYFTLQTNEQGYIWHIDQKQMQQDLQFGKNKVYEVLNILQEKKLVEYNGRKKCIRVV